MKILAFLTLLVLASCAETVQPQSSAPERPMDEVPMQRVLQGGDREYRFANGCVIVLEPRRAVVRTESDDCELLQRDIALLYASGD